MVGGRKPLDAGVWETFREICCEVVVEHRIGRAPREQDGRINSMESLRDVGKCILGRVAATGLKRNVADEVRHGSTVCR